MDESATREVSRVAFTVTRGSYTWQMIYLSGINFFVKSFQALPKQTGDNQDPLYRLFFREGAVGRKLLDQVRKDLGDVVKVCEGALKQTNHLRTLMSSLTKGTIP